MADLSDVENALVALISSAVYPNGIGVSSLFGCPVKIRRGWPVSQQLDKDLSAGCLTITVFPMNNSTRNTTRFMREWHSEPAIPSMTASTSGNVVTWSGAPEVGQIAGVLYAGQPYFHVVSASDTLNSIASTFAGMVSGVTASGASVTYPIGGDGVVANVVVSSFAEQEIRRQVQSFQITIWSPTYSLRDSCGSVIDQTLAPVDFLDLADGTAAWLRFRSNKIDDVPTKDNLWRRDMVFTAEYPTVQRMSSTAIMFAGISFNGNAPLVTSNLPTFAPLIGAIRFDGFCASTAQSGSVASQNAAALSMGYTARLPFYATVTSGVASWGAETQAQMDQEIQAAEDAGIDFWAFDSYQPTDEETAALELYLSSSIRAKIGFCMLGQFSNWGLSGGAPYSAAAQRDVTMLAEYGYVTVLGGRPLYFVLGSGTDTQMASAITWFRAQSVAQGTGNPYVVLLSGAPLSLYNNVPDAQNSGADAAGAYECPYLNGAPQPYTNLTATAAADWDARAETGFPMTPCAMTDFDPRPLVQTPQSYYPVPNGWNLNNYYQTGTPSQIAAHISGMKWWMQQNQSANPSGVGLVYSWNELAEGGKGLVPTYLPGNPYGDVTRSIALGEALSEV